MRTREHAPASLFVSLLAVFFVGCGGSEHELGSKSSALTVTPTAKGVVLLDAAAYRAPGTVQITVLDSDVSGGVAVHVASTTNPKGFYTNIKQTSDGVFQGSVGLVLTATKGSLQVKNDDTITVTYQDADDGTGQAYTAPTTAKVDNTLPDLYEASVTYSASSVPAGGTISVTDTVTADPRGSSPAGPFYVYFYVSQSSTFSPNAIGAQLGYRYVSGLATGQSSTATTELALPLNLNGPYYIYAWANPWSGSVVETDGAGWPNVDANNVAGGPQFPIQ
ncbi:MAG TPA: hypothetical protein VF875_11385 [Anaeromyxobacter sp.]